MKSLWSILLACVLSLTAAYRSTAGADADKEQARLEDALEQILQDLRSDDPAETGPSSPEQGQKQPPPPAPEETPEEAPVPVSENGVLRVRPGQLLSVTVTVAGEKEVEDRGKRVSSTGDVTLSLVGTLPVGGLTLAELRTDLTRRYEHFLRAPLVEVSYEYGDSEEGRGAASPWGTVTVLGRVKKPGRINIPPTQDLTLSMAIQEAGGFDSSAKDKAITVTRQLPDGSANRVQVDMRAVATRGQEDLVLHDGDVVFVPERIF